MLLFPSAKFRKRRGRDKGVTRSLPLGTSYAIWTGIGAVGAAIIGIVRFNEPRDWPRVACIALIVVGIVGLRILHRA